MGRKQRRRRRRAANIAAHNAAVAAGLNPVWQTDNMGGNAASVYYANLHASRPPQQQPAPPPQMPVYIPPRLDQQLASNIGQTEAGVASARKKRSKRTNLSKLKINLNPSASPFGNVGTGLNIGVLT